MLEGSEYTTTTPFKFELRTIESERLIFEPLLESHISELLPLFNAEIWKWYTHQINSENALRDFLKHILDEQTMKKTLAFVVRDKKSRELVGSTRLFNLQPSHRRVEIGSTWYGVKWQRTFVNTESKLALLTHAFEDMACVNVVLQTDMLNEKSKIAIERLGAKLDGILRNDRICEDGRIRHSAYYSILSSEWNDVKLGLRKRLDSYR